MRIKFNKTRLFATLAVAAVTALPAFAVVEVEITDSTGTHVYTGTVCGPDCSSVTASDGDAQFSIDIEAGGSNGPSGPATVQVTGLITAIKTGLLTVEVSDTGFLSPVGNANLVQTVNTNTSANGAATGSVTGTGYYGTGAGNVIFCADTSVCTTKTPNASFNSFLVTNPGQVTSTPVNFVSPYSLDEVLSYNFTKAGNADVTATLSAVQGVPEPASVALFGGLAALTFFATRRRRTKNV